MKQETQIALKQETKLAQLLDVDDALASALKNSIFPGAKDESIKLAWDYCKARKLDVMKKPCHIVPMNVKDSKTGKYSWRDVIMPGITEARITATRTGQHGGLSPAKYGPVILLRIGKTDHEVPEYCEITAYKIINGERIGFSHTEYFEEACATTKEGELNSMWTKRKRGQLAKCAEAGALRKAFPDELGGEITAEEANPNSTMVEREMKPANVVSDTPKNPFGEKLELPEQKGEKEGFVDDAILAKINAAWKALGKANSDILVAIKHVGGDCNVFEDLGQSEGEKLLKILEKQIKERQATKSKLDPENPYQKAEEPEGELELEGSVA